MYFHCADARLNFTMRRRVLTTTKILAVALVGTSACNNASAPADAAAPATSSAAAHAPSAPPAQVASAPPVVDAKLEVLRGELASLKRADALSQLSHFRPLCDKDGYPLVGNLARKGDSPAHVEGGLDVSELCAEVRKKPGS